MVYLCIGIHNANLLMAFRWILMGLVGVWIVPFDGVTVSILLFHVFLLFFLIHFLRRMGEKKISSSPHFYVFSHTSCVNLIQLRSQSSWFSGVSFSSRDSDIIARELSLPAVPVTTPAAQAAVVYGCVSMSTRPDSLGSGAVRTATRNGIIPGSVGLAQNYPLTTKTPITRKQPHAGLGPVMVHPTHSGVGPFLPNSYPTTQAEGVRRKHATHSV